MVSDKKSLAREIGVTKDFRHEICDECVFVRKFISEFCDFVYILALSADYPQNFQNFSQNPDVRMCSVIRAKLTEINYNPSHIYYETD